MLSSPALLASFTSHYTPTGPAETLLVRRIVATTLRLDLLERAFDALLELGERRALVDHLAETCAINEPKLQARDAPNYAAMLRRYDGAAEIPPDFDPALDPDPALCNLAYTLSSPRAAALMRHEATAERRLHAAMRELHHLQADRRKQEKECNEPTMPRSRIARNEATTSLPAAPWKEATHGAAMELHSGVGNEPISRHGMVSNAAARNAPITSPLDTARNKATTMYPVHGRLALDATIHATPTHLPKHSTAGIKNEPTTRSTSSQPIHTARTVRSEPIPAASLLSPLPISSGAARPLPAQQRRMSQPDPLERLIRRAERSACSIY